MVKNLFAVILTALLTTLNIVLYLDNPTRWLNLGAAIICGIGTIFVFVLLVKRINENRR